MLRIEVLPTVSLKLINKEPTGEISPITDDATTEIFSFVLFICSEFVMSDMETHGIVAFDQ